MILTSLTPKLFIVKVLALESIGPNLEQVVTFLEQVQFVTPFSKFTMTMYYDF